MIDDPKHDLVSDYGTKAERNAQYTKDKVAMEARNTETELLIKQLDNIKNIEKLAAESNHADQFKNIRYVEREEDPELKK